MSISAKMVAEEADGEVERRSVKEAAREVQRRAPAAATLVERLQRRAGGEVAAAAATLVKKSWRAWRGSCRSASVPRAGTMGSSVLSFVLNPQKKRK